MGIQTGDPTIAPTTLTPATRVWAMMSKYKLDFAMADMDLVYLLA
jgi:hypothetical protein